MVRDIRAILKRCRSNCKELCDDMKNDLAVFEKLKQKRPDRYYLIKFEDVVTNPENEIKKLFEFLNLPVTTSVRMAFNSHVVTRVTKDLPIAMLPDSNKSQMCFPLSNA